MSDPPAKSRFQPMHLVLALAVLTLFLGLFSAYFNTGGHKPMTGQEGWRLEQLRAVGAAMQAYAADHGGRFPAGENSTEVFNELIATGYLEDHRMAMRGGKGHKSLLDVVGGGEDEEPTDPATTRLQSAEVAWDVTAVGASESAHPDLPLVFSTGHKVSYAPGSVPVPVASDADRVVYVYTFGGKWRLYRLDKQASWEHPFLPADFEPSETMRQLRPSAE
ncbi:MAG: hypothetical protein AAGK14_12355 [Verrucomicrobiota bacterium]